MPDFRGTLDRNEAMNRLLNTMLTPEESIEKKIDEYKKLLVDAGKYSADKLSKYRKALQKQELEDREKQLKKIEEQSASRAQKTFSKLSGTFLTTVSKSFSSIDSYLEKYSKYLGVINTRLQGTALNFNTISANIAKNLVTSPYLRQEDMLDNLNKFVQSGIAYNLETRAFIATASNKIASTFDAFDSTLLRIIRIQQADSTVARLGMESLLTKFLNAKFEDTSYLNSSASISGLLTEAESLMGYKGSAEFEYIVQKWLGSMSSLGVSSNTISSIATGLGYLGSGQASALSGNTALRNLIYLGASRAGLNAGELLSGGLNAQTTNALLRGIVQLGQDIGSTSNNVARAEYANLFGLSVSDLVSLTNMTTETLDDITNNIVKYEQLRNETTNSLATIAQRTSTSEKVQNVISNVLTSMGANVANNPLLYATWLAAGLLSKSGLDPTFNIGPSWLSTSTSVSSLLKTGVVGASFATSLINAIGNLASGNLGGTSLSVWGERETRGSGLNTYSSGLGSSARSYIGSISSDEMNKSALEDIKQEQITYAGEEETTSTQIRDIYDVLNDNIREDITSIRTMLENFNLNLSSSGLGRLLLNY